MAGAGVAQGDVGETERERVTSKFKVHLSDSSI